jgi:excinuclease ABC subunit C
MREDIIQKIKGAPKHPGVYIFYRKQSPLYVGKASNLRNRLKNYLSVTDFKTKALHQEADMLKLITLHSNIEALITESQLIKKLKPKYNVLWRDDKNYFYVAITKEKFPRIFITHQLTDENTEYIGPFTDGNPLKVILRLLRRAFPYCTCRASTRFGEAGKPHLRICLNSQIGNCPGYCCRKQEIRDEKLEKRNRKRYSKNIEKIKNILTGKNKKFITTLKDPYELLILEKIWAHEPYLEASGVKHSAIREENKKNLNANRYTLTASKAECYDNSHLSGKEAVGAMTAWVKELGVWRADRNMWRKFKIRGNYTEDDPRMMEEIVSRRFNHPEWPYPNLLIIDGGITQLNAAKRALSKLKSNSLKLKAIRVISFAKPEQQVYGWKLFPVPLAELPDELQKLIPMAIQNTHNFAVRYHRTVRRRGIIQV